MSNATILALDVGEKRIGAAIATIDIGLPRPLKTINYNDALVSLPKIIDAEHVRKIIVGLPLNSQDKPSKQTEFTNAFIEKLKSITSLPIETCDEALSSKRAKDELFSKKKPFKKEAVDALAATYILDDYLKENL